MAKTCKVCGQRFRAESHLDGHGLSVEEYEALEPDQECELCGRRVALEAHLEAVHGLTLEAYQALPHCKVCGQKVQDPGQHAGAEHGMSEDQYARFDPTPLPGGPIETSHRVVPQVQPLPPEPTVKIRLADVDSNPFSVGVEARRGCVYHFQKRGKWQSIPALDAWILLGGEDIPPKYPHFKFEKRS